MMQITEYCANLVYHLYFFKYMFLILKVYDSKMVNSDFIIILFAPSYTQCFAHILYLFKAFIYGDQHPH